MKLSVLVTGGAGFIGSHLVDALLANGHSVRVLDNLDSQVHGDLAKKQEWPHYCNPNAEYILGDVRDRDIVCSSLQGVDAVFHMAAKVGVGQSMYEVESYIDVNIGGTAVLLDVIANEIEIQNRLKRIIVASSMSNYGEGEYECPVHGTVFPPARSKEQLKKHQWELRCPLPSSTQAGECDAILTPVATRESKPLQASSVYAISKKTQEELCLTVGQAYGITTMALRFFNTYGPRQALTNPYTGVAAIFSSRLLNENPPAIFEDGKQIRDFVHVSDLVQACLLMLHDRVKSGVYNVGSGSPISIVEIAKILAEHLELPIEPEILQQARIGDVRHCFADIDRIVSLGYEPQFSLAEGITQLVDWVRLQRTDDLFETATHSLKRKGLTI